VSLLISNYITENRQS